MKMISRKTYIIVQITNDSMLISLYKKWGNTLYSTYTMLHVLNNHEITHQSITNPTKIMSLIHQELEKHHVKNGVIIASVPFLQELDMPTILQIALVLGKHTLPLIYLTNQPVITTGSKKISWSSIKKQPNLLDYMLPKHYQTARWWFAGAALGLCLGVIIFSSARHFYTHQKKELEHSFCAVSYKAKQCDTHDMSKKVLRLEKESDAIQRTLSLLEQSSKSPAQLDMLIAIAKATPPHSWLENLSLTNTTSQKTNTICMVEMTGNTNKPQEISDIINNLGQKYTINTLSLKKIQQHGNSKSGETLYAFVIKGELGGKRG